ncbi:IS200/IS605 family transposase, partial [Lactobacillus delbrueckii]|uniref:IS200/IS605 family transposase n=1 Tax=Lactobacillus delbrueckii TaxID=1584 RepID=UPI001F23DABE
MIVYERGCVYNFNFHLVFVTKYRKEVFDSPEKVEEMKGLLQKRADMSDIQIQEMEVMPDHVHM